MEERIWLCVEDLTLLVSTRDWVQGRLVAETWTGSGASRVRPLLDIVRQRRLTTYRLESPGQDPLHFAGYMTGYRCESQDAHVVHHTITVMIDGPVWRDDDTPVEGLNTHNGFVWDAPLVPVSRTLRCRES